MTNEENIKNHKTYVVYDQFHWNDPDHIEYRFDGWESALANYGFFKDANPDKTLGLTDLENFNAIKQSIRRR